MKTYFISGHLDLTRDEFTEHYQSKMEQAIAEQASFLVGDAPGADTLAQQYLRERNYFHVKVFHMMDAPRNNLGFETTGGFTCDASRDMAMSKASHEDIAWVRPGREQSGTANNLHRRQRLLQPKFAAHVPWPEINQAHTLRKAIVQAPEILGSLLFVRYRGKIKLHGTNAAVHVRADGQVLAQSRSQMLSVNDDNSGFAQWVKRQEGAFQKARTHERDVILFGEWAGPGIQRGTALNQLEHKIFAVFAAQYLDEIDSLVTEPQDLAPLVKDVPQTYVLPWDSFQCDINWLAESSVLQAQLESVNERVAQVEHCDPWVHTTFGVQGIGEGLVMYPERQGLEAFSRLAWKAKGEKHKVINNKKAAQAEAEVIHGVDEFVALVVTEARLEQGLASVKEIHSSQTGAFVNWLLRDVEKETTAEREAARLTWKQVQSAVASRGRHWFLERVRAV